MEKKENVREIAVDTLMLIMSGKEQSHILIRNVLKKYNYMEECDKAFLKRVTEGTLERLISIDYVINQFSKVKVNKMKPFIRSLIRMSVYQILYMDKVPDSAACNEAVKLANKRKFSQLKGFVNGVLRNIARNKDRLTMPDRSENPQAFLSVCYSMPEFLVNLLLKQYGEEETEKILAGYFEEHPVSVRIRESLSAREQKETREYLKKKCGMLTENPILPYACLIQGSGDLSQDPYFREGKYTVQDVSSMLVGEVAGFKKGDRVLDVCSAPGGKAAHACDKMLFTGSVEARDVSGYKTALILENKERMQLSNLTVKVWDATEYDENSREQYDVVLLDLPCSGLGVIGKKPEIRYRLNEENLKELELLQKKIADTVWDYVKPGGTLVYSTCTIRKEENEEMVSYLTSACPFRPVSLDDRLPKQLRNQDSAKGYLTLLPGKFNDGFFIAKMVRREK